MSKIIILHGSGRSGTTMLNNILVNHPDLGWLSNLQLYALNYPIVSYLNRFVNSNVDLNNLKRSKFSIHSCNEPYEMWKKYYPSFQKELNNPTGRPYALQEFVEKILFFSGKKQFITKITGYARADYLNHAFKDYHVVWIDREPSAVICSMMKQRWGFKKRLEVFDAMTGEEQITYYFEYYKKIMETKKEIASERLINVAYEDLVSNPVLFFEELLAKLNIPPNDKFTKTIKNWNMKPIDEEFYKKQLSKGEWEYLTKLIAS